MERQAWQDIERRSPYIPCIGTPFDWMIRRKSFAPSSDPFPDPEVQILQVRIVSSSHEFASAESLVATRYAWRGYRTFTECGSNPGAADRSADCFTLLATRDDDTVGTITAGIDADAGLLIDEGNRDAVDALRRAGRRVAEFVKLAVQDEVDAKGVLYRLFRTAYEYVRLWYQATDILIEVNPRHASFYQKVLGFAVAGSERICPRVNAPAILLRLDLEELDQRHGVGYGLGVANVERRAA